jgi:hypothetical protein
MQPAALVNRSRVMLKVKNYYQRALSLCLIINPGGSLGRMGKIKGEDLMKYEDESNFIRALILILFSGSTIKKNRTFELC